MQGKTIISKYCGDDFTELISTAKYGYKKRANKKMRKALARKSRRELVRILFKEKEVLLISDENIWY